MMFRRVAAGVPGSAKKRWFEGVTEADGTPISAARKTPLPRRWVPPQTIT